MWEVIPDFLRFAGNNILIGYNSVDFDAKFLRRAGRYSNTVIDNPVFDVMRYAGELKDLIGLASRRVKLDELAEKLNITNGRNLGAYEEACKIAEVFLKLKDLDNKSQMDNEILLKMALQDREGLYIELEEKKFIRKKLQEDGDFYIGSPLVSKAWE